MLRLKYENTHRLIDVTDKGRRHNSVLLKLFQHPAKAFVLYNNSLIYGFIFPGGGWLKDSVKDKSRFAYITCCANTI